MDIQNAQTILKEKKPITTLSEFYTLMQATREIRSALVAQYLQSQTAEKNSVDLLKNGQDVLQEIVTTQNGKLAIDEDRTIAIDLSYETTELQKDLLFLTEGEDALYSHFDTIHPTLETQIAVALPLVKKVGFKNFISDRDGTVNNYCGRYLSSIQSVYNAVFLSRYARNCVNNAILLTSAPLENGGMVDVCTMPDATFILAGSKGREYRDKAWNRATFPIDPEQQNILATLTEQIVELLQKPEFEKFTYIGSGFQRKFGQLTIARQDISDSIPEQESHDFLQIISNLVTDLDRDNKFFRIEDTGLDIEIVLTIGNLENNGNVKDFDKGNGVLFLDSQLHLNMHRGPNLICGDTGSDIAMVQASLTMTTTHTHAIFVTTDPSLQEQVQSLHPATIILDEPDTLVVLLNELSKR